VRVAVTDDVHVPNGDAVELEIQSAAGVTRKRLASPVREVDVTRYDCTFPLSELKVSAQEVGEGFGFSFLLHEDDGQGPDGVMTLPPVTVRCP
jgi:hypothetical protein